MVSRAKRRKISSGVEEITFDPVARHEFLTGFRKRKQQRIRQAREYAEKKAREERRLERKRIREERAAEVQRVLEETRKRLEELDSESDSGNKSSEEEEWQGFDEPPPVDYEAEYIDEDKYTTVTVEEMDSAKDELYNAVRTVPDKTETGLEEFDEERKAESNTSATSKRKTNKTKKRKKFRYESKAERMLTQYKERMAKRRKAQARRSR